MGMDTMFESFMKGGTAEDKKKTESAIKSNPIEAAEAIPKSSPLHKEAVQAIDGGKDAEVSNKALDDAFAQFVEEQSKKDKIKALNDLPALMQQDEARNDIKSDYNFDGSLKEGAETEKSRREKNEDLDDQLRAAYGNLGIDYDQMKSDNAGKWKKTKQRAVLDALSGGTASPSAGTPKKNSGMLSEGIDWDKVKVFKPGEDATGYGIVKEDFDPRVEKNNEYFRQLEAEAEAAAENNPEKVIDDPMMPEALKKEAADLLDNDSRNDEADNTQIEKAVSKLSEDFDTPDDLYEYLVNEYGEESKGPDDIVSNEEVEQLQAEMANGDNTVYDERMANSPVIPDSQLEPAPELPYADNVVQIKDEEAEQLQEEAMELPKMTAATDVTIGSGAHGGSYSGEKTEIPDSRSSVGTPGSRMSVPSAGVSHVGGGVHGASAASSSHPSSKQPASVSHASGGANPVQSANDEAAVSIGARQGADSNGGLTSNGTNLNSGAVKQTGSSLTVKPTALPNGEAHTQDYSGGLLEGAGSLKDAHLANLEVRIRSIPIELAEQLGFSTKYKHVTYNGLSISECEPQELQEIEKILTTLGV